MATPADDPNQTIDPPKPTAYDSSAQSYPPCCSASTVSGILSNTEESRPSANADCQDGSGRLLTGISEAAATRAARKIAPFAPCRITDHSGFAHRLVTRMAAQSA